MKRIAALLLSTLLLLSLTACADSDANAQKKIEKVLGDVTQLPMELAQSKERLGDSAISGKMESDDDDMVCEVAIGSDIVLFSITVTSDLEMLNGDKYPVTVRALCVGTAKEESENTYKLHLIGGNFTLTFDIEDAQVAADQFATDMDTAFAQGDLDVELSEEEIALWKKFAHGEQIWTTGTTYLWEVFADFDTDLKVTYNTDSGEFRLTTGQSKGDRTEKTYYPDGRLKSELFYSEGLDAFYEEKYYSYPEAGGTEVSFTHYSFRDIDQVDREGWYYYAGEVDSTIRPTKGWEKIYSDGIISQETNYNEDGTTLNTGYDDQGKMRWRDLLGVADSQGIAKTVWEELYENGILSERTEYVDENTTVNETYYPDGALSSREKEVGNRKVAWYATLEGFDENGTLNYYRYSYYSWPEPPETMVEEKILLIKYYENEQTETIEYEYDENWNLLSSKVEKVDENGNLLYLQIDGNVVEERVNGLTVEETGKYYESGYTVWTFHSNGGRKTCERMYEAGKTYTYTEWNEAGVEIKYYKYNEAGELLSGSECQDDGTRIYEIWYNPDGTDWDYYSETYYYENGNMKSCFSKFPDGAQRWERSYETGETQYFKFVYAHGFWYEEYYYKNGQTKYCANYESDGTLASEFYYLEDGTMVYKYIRDDGVQVGEKPDWDLLYLREP